MNPIRQIALAARPALQWLALAIIGTILVVGGLYVAKRRVAADAALARATHQAGLATLAQREADLKNVATHIKDYQALQRSGLVGSPAREAWVEQLLAARVALRLPDTLTYVLNAPAPFEAVQSDAAESTPVTHLTHDLSVELSGIHELDLLRLIDRLRDTAGGRFRIQSCQLTNPGASGMTARCVLRFFTLQEGA